MKTMGILGGMSWKSTQSYYQIMNDYIYEIKGGHWSVDAVIYSVNFSEIYDLLSQNLWHDIAKMLVKLAHKLEAAGAEFILVASNAAHKVSTDIEKSINIPFLHIVDPTAKALKDAKIKKVGLLGTGVTMSEDFYKERLRERWNIDVVIPAPEEQLSLDHILFEEVLLGKKIKDSKEKGMAILQNLEKQGVEAIILGCTELNLFIESKDTSLPLFDTTMLHAKAAVDFAFTNRFVNFL